MKPMMPTTEAAKPLERWGGATSIALSEPARYNANTRLKVRKRIFGHTVGILLRVESSLPSYDYESLPIRKR